MGAYSKVQFVDTDTVAQENVVEKVDSNSAINEEVSKFDNSYEVKLQELYKEYDKITLDEEKIKSMTEIKVNASKKSLSFRMGLALTTTVAVAIMLVFLCIYNIFVINGMTGDINYLQQEVASSRYELVEAERAYNSNLDSNAIQKELKDKQFGVVDSVESIDVPEKTVVIELESSTNWFDAICNFLSRVFG